MNNANLLSTLNLVPTYTRNCDYKRENRKCLAQNKKPLVLLHFTLLAEGKVDPRALGSLATTTTTATKTPNLHI